MTEWLSVVNECKIKCSAQTISESLQSVMLDVDKELKSLDVQSLYTNEALRSYRRQYGVAFLRDDILRDVKNTTLKQSRTKSI